MWLKYTSTGHLLISPEDDCRETVSAMLATGYNEDFCIAEDFSPGFAARLMEAGFLLMSADIAPAGCAPDYILLPKLHIERSVLLFERLHVKKSIRRFLNRYELRPDADFDAVVSRCVEKHGADWLTEPLLGCIKKIRDAACGSGDVTPSERARPASFALYRGGRLAAGEFGVVCGRVYTSYSGFYDEANAGTVQLILTTRYLREQGFSFFDLGMPMDYKDDLGALNVNAEVFTQLFRAAQITTSGNNEQ